MRGQEQQAFCHVQTVEGDQPEALCMTHQEADAEAVDLLDLMAEMSRIDGLLTQMHLGTTQLDEMMRELGSELVLDPEGRTQRRLGDIDYELLSR